MLFLCLPGALSIEQLLEKYRGAYEDDGEASTSQESSEDESDVSEEGEEDSRESDSDAESRSSSGSNQAAHHRALKLELLILIGLLSVGSL